MILLAITNLLIIIKRVISYQSTHQIIFNYYLLITDINYIIL